MPFSLFIYWISTTSLLSSVVLVTGKKQLPYGEFVICESIQTLVRAHSETGKRGSNTRRQRLWLFLQPRPTSHQVWRINQQQRQPADSPIDKTVTHMSSSAKVNTRMTFASTEASATNITTAKASCSPAIVLILIMEQGVKKSCQTEVTGVDWR